MQISFDVSSNSIVTDEKLIVHLIQQKAIESKHTRVLSSLYIRHYRVISFKMGKKSM